MNPNCCNLLKDLEFFRGCVIYQKDLFLQKNFNLKMFFEQIFLHLQLNLRVTAIKYNLV